MFWPWSLAIVVLDLWSKAHARDGNHLPTPSNPAIVCCCQSHPLQPACASPCSLKHHGCAVWINAFSFPPPGISLGSFNTEHSLHMSDKQEKWWLKGPSLLRLVDKTDVVGPRAWSLTGRLTFTKGLIKIYHCSQSIQNCNSSM